MIANDELRKQALEKYQETTVQRSGKNEALSPEEVQRTLEELRIHQIELEMQNDELRRTQGKLDTADVRFFDFYDLAPVGYCTINENGLILEANLTFARFLGVNRKTLVRQMVTRFILPADQDAFYLYRRQLLETEIMQSCELRICKQDGAAFWARMESICVRNSDNLPVFRLVMSDITKRKQAEEVLREAHWRLESIIEGTHVGTWEWNVQTGETVFNETWAQIIGYKLDELSPISIKTWESFAEPDSLKESSELMERHFAGELPYYDCECRMRHKDGRWVWVHDRGRIITHTADGKPLMMFGTHSDITKRKQAEEEIQQGEMLLRKLVDILQHPAETIQDFLDYALGQAIELTKSKIGYIYHYHEDRKEFVLNTWSKEVMAECTVASQQTCYELEKTGIWGEAVRQRKPIILNDFPAAHPLKKGYPAGHAQLFKFLTVPLLRGESIVGVVGLANKKTDYNETDILQVSLLMEAGWKVVERKLAEDKIKTLLAEKEIILKEVHHRIKNNMSTINSLLSLQAGTLKDTQAIAALEDTGKRVQSMMVLYEKLYQSSNYQEMPISNYLPSLVDEIVANFPNTKSVKIEKNIGNFILDAKRLQPLGMIINEVLTNIMKYAFEGRDDGIITVSAALKDDKISVIIGDNGNGIPESVDFENSSGFGLLLVRGLTQQLGGTVRIERGNGTRIILEFGK